MGVGTLGGISGRKAVSAAAKKIADEGDKDGSDQPA